MSATAYSRISLTLFFFLPLLTACENGAGKITLETDFQKSSYAVGRQIGQGMKKQGLEIDAQILATGVADVLEEKESRMSEVELAAAVRKMQQAARLQRMQVATKMKGKGSSFLQENKNKPGITVTKSGLQYQVLKKGTGASPKASDRVKVHYKGTFIDGKEFDSSYKRDRPAEFGVGGVIRGWTEALQLMKKGGKWKLFIPGDLAYGPSGRPGIPPNSTLIFEVELLDIL